MKSFTTISSLVFLLLAYASPGYAILISTDWKTAGDGLLTFDDDSGLEWLDAPLTVGRSYNDLVGIDGSDELGIGGDFEGFRLASSGEVKSLFIDALGIPPSAFAQWKPDTYGKVITLHSLFGVTSGGDFAEIRSITSDVYDSATHWQSFARICQNGYTIGTGSNACDFADTANVNTNGSLMRDDSSRSTGAWLIRDGFPRPVSEPGVLALLGIGLAGIGVFRKRALG